MMRQTVVTFRLSSFAHGSPRAWRSPSSTPKMERTDGRPRWPVCLRDGRLLLCCALPRRAVFGETNQPDGEQYRGQHSDALFLRSRSKSGVGQGWRSLQTHTCNCPRRNARKRELIGVASCRGCGFRGEEGGSSPVDVESSPRGRTASLVPEESLRRPLRESALATAKSEPPSRAPKQRDQASKSPRNSGFSSAESAPLAEGLSTASRQTSGVQSDEGAGVRQGSRRARKVKSSSLRRSGAEPKGKTKRQVGDLSRRRHGHAFA